METREKSWFKRGKTVSALGKPLIIFVAEPDDAGKKWWAEYFLMVGGRDPKLYIAIGGVDGSDWPPEVAVPDFIGVATTKMASLFRSRTMTSQCWQRR